jgi:hypothetical protein
MTKIKNPLAERLISKAYFCAFSKPVGRYEIAKLIRQKEKKLTSSIAAPIYKAVEKRLDLFEIKGDKYLSKAEPFLVEVSRILKEKGTPLDEYEKEELKDFLDKDFRKNLEKFTSDPVIMKEAMKKEASCLFFLTTFLSIAAMWSFLNNPEIIEQRLPKLLIPIPALLQFAKEVTLKIREEKYILTVTQKIPFSLVKKLIQLSPYFALPFERLYDLFDNFETKTRELSKAVEEVIKRKPAREQQKIKKTFKEIGEILEKELLTKY